MDLSKTAPSQVRFDTVARPEDLRAFENLLNGCFGTAAYFDDFPIWRESRPDLVRIGAWEGSRLVGCAAARLAHAKTPTGGMTVGLIGAVATDPAYRGRGLASRAVQLALEWLQSRKASIAVLWGSEVELYGKLGFELCGSQVAVPLAALQLAETTGTAIHRGWVPGLFGLLQDRSEGLALRPEDRSWIQAHRNVQWYWTGPADRPKAYAAIGRGIDLQNCVHEWGGDPAELRALLVRIRQEFPESMLLASPQGLERLSRHVGIAPGTASQQFLALVKVLDGKQVLLGYGKSIEPPPGDFKLSTLFFGPSASTSAESGHFPLPLWFWGLDSA